MQVLVVANLFSLTIVLPVVVCQIESWIINYFLSSFYHLIHCHKDSLMLLCLSKICNFFVAVEVSYNRICHELLSFPLWLATLQDPYRFALTFPPWDFGDKGNWQEYEALATELWTTKSFSVGQNSYVFYQSMWNHDSLMQ